LGERGLYFGLKSEHYGNRMPLRFYAPLQPPCRLCGPGFEHRLSVGEPDLQECPKCGQPVRRSAAQTVNSPKLSAPLSVSRARQAGFTVLKRTSGGEYERQ
jgi:hypothetical protein